MGLPEILLLAVSLSMDAFAAALCRGLNMKRFRPGRALTVGLFFGGFQALMPLLGWLLGGQFASFIADWDHWIAFGLLAYIGGRMIFEVYRGGESCGDCRGEDCRRDDFSIKELLGLSVATSIDALAVGVTFAFLSVSIIPAASIIGATTFFLSFIGVAIGNRVGLALKKKAELIGGAALVLIGVKILLEHLGVF